MSCFPSPPPNGLGEAPQRAQECLPHSIGVSEPTFLGDGCESQLTVINEIYRSLDAQALDHMGRRLPHFAFDHTTQLTGAHVRDGCQVFDR